MGKNKNIRVLNGVYFKNIKLFLYLGPFPKISELNDLLSSIPRTKHFHYGVKTDLFILKTLKN